MPRHKKGSRGVELKNLGNFLYERQRDFHDFSSRPAMYRRKVDSVALKRAFMLQNYQFVLRHDVQEMKTTPVLPQGQRRLREALLLSDTAPPWDAVTAVVMRVALEECQCPICLETPVAARVGDCGHVFCLPCMLHYFSRLKEERKQRSCPVCHNFLTLGMLRRCVLRPVSPIRPGKCTTFSLLRRYGACCVLLREDGQNMTDGKELVDELALPSFNEPSAVFSRYIFETTKSETAQRDLDCRGIMDRLSDISTQPRPLTKFDDEIRRFSEEALEMVLNENASQSLQTETRNSPPIAPKEPNVDLATVFDLYGESEGQPYYVHPITFKMLREDAKARGRPILDTVEAPVEEIVTFTQDEASRKRYKAFAHVPIHGTVKLCILDLTGLVLQSTLDAFAPTLARMRAARQVREASGAGCGEDTSWQAYLRRYSALGAQSAVDPNRSPDFVPSEFSGVSDILPSLEQLSSSSVTAFSDSCGFSGDSSLKTRQRETKRHAMPIASCWSMGDSRRLFVSPSVQSVVPTWGGHVLNLHKSS